MVNIEGLNKAEVLMDLYNNSKQNTINRMSNNTWNIASLAMIFSTGLDLMTLQQSQKLLERANPEHIYFDYIDGVVMKMNFTSDVELDTTLYDRDNGEGAGEKIINSIRNRSNKQ